MGLREPAAVRCQDQEFQEFPLSLTPLGCGPNQPSTFALAVAGLTRVPVILRRMVLNHAKLSSAHNETSPLGSGETRRGERWTPPSVIDQGLLAPMFAATLPAPLAPSLPTHVLSTTVTTCHIASKKGRLETVQSVSSRGKSRGELRAVGESRYNNARSTGFNL